MERDTVIIAEGGCMQGVFGAGVMTAFQEANLNKRVHSVYGSSAGAHNLAYFLSEQGRLGSSVYYEEMTKDFIKLSNIPVFLKDVLTHKFKKNNIRNIIDMDYIVEIESKIKKIDVQKIMDSNVNFYVRAFDIENLKFEYIDAKEDILAALKASSNSSPYYSNFVEIGKRKYIDGSVINTREFLRIVESNKDKKVIVVLNEQSSIFRTALAFPFYLIESLIFGALHGNKVMLKNLSSLFSYPTVKEISKYSNVHIVASDKRCSKSCTDREKLLDLYNHGIEKGKEFLKKIENS